MVVDKKREVRLRWFEHVEKRCTDIPVMRCGKLAIGGMRRDRSRPKKYWEEVLRSDTTQLQVTKDMVLDKRMWRTHIRVEG
ncbi:hypothetical protein H5410_042057 [Solanum commersonii]|uniref:Uncharacterized protein n=1 Tax=Solanum commersonii TaxID=4109 RepID=A0A9J5XVB3_SOLCO|nr:hypothetical protein H5410_042057 [Solanum commersonii]